MNKSQHLPTANERHLISQAGTSFLRRRKKGSSAWRYFGLLVIAPTLISAIYYILIAAPVYESVAEVALRDMQGQGGGGILDSFISRTFGAAGSQDTRIVQHYMMSREMVAKLEAAVGLRKILGSPKGDFLARLGSSATDEELYARFQNVAEVEYTVDSGILTLRVRAFTPEDAQAVAQAVIVEADGLVGRMSSRARADALGNAEAELQRAEEKLLDISSQVATFREIERDISPVDTAKALGGVVGRIEEELVSTRVKLAEMQSYMQPNSPLVGTLRSRMTSLERQLERARSRVAKPSDSDRSMVDKVSMFEQLKLQSDLARRAYEVALAARESARQEANRRTTYLVAFVSPNRPDEASYPKRLQSIAGVLAVLTISFGLVSLLVASIKEHSRT